MDADDGLMQAYISSTRRFEVGSIPFPTYMPVIILRFVTFQTGRDGRN
jgi:hypothetical protein